MTRVLGFLVPTFLMCVVLLEMPANLARLSSVSFFASGTYYNATLLAFVMLSICSLLFFRQNKKTIRFLLCYALFLFYAIFMAAINGNASAISAAKYYMLPAIAFVFVANFSGALRFLSCHLFWRCVVISHAASYAWYVAKLKGIIYPGIGVPSIVFALIFFAWSRSFVWFLISLMLLVVEGKRGIMLSVLLTLPMMLWLKSATLNQRVGAALLGIVLVLAAATSLYLISGLEGVGLVARINNLNPFSQQFDLALGSSGRLGEITSYVKQHEFYDFIFGAGLGFEYDWELGYATATGVHEDKGYFHLTPMNYWAVGGVFGVFFYLWLCSFSIRVTLDSFDSTGGLAMAFAVYCVFQSMFGFSFATNFLHTVLLFYPYCRLLRR